MNVKKLISVATIMLTVGMIHAQGSNGLKIHYLGANHSLIQVKQPQKYLFFDEATNALDTDNEKVIQGNLEKFFKDKTVVIVAHRLSTVKNADQIVVLKEGEITEKGTHDELITRQGDYYRLVKNQLELSA